MNSSYQPKEISTRDHILQMLKTAGPLSIKEITEQVGITEMAIRRHIAAMERDGLIESKMIRQTLGRPTAVYGLTNTAEHLFPKKYHTLALDLLGELEEEAGEDAVNHLFNRRKAKLNDKYKAVMEGKSFSEKVRLLAEIQNENGYMAECEQVEDQYYILKEHNCPISDIANRYNHACECELQLFESLLNASVERTECLAQEGNRCVYLIRNKA